jgi:hypothetical protein
VVDKDERSISVTKSFVYLNDKKLIKMEDDDWEERQMKAAATIRLCLSNHVMYHVILLSTQKEI